MARFKPREHKFPEEIEFLGLADVLARSHPRGRRVPGIYFLIEGQQIVYVGKSMNLPVRIHQHRLRDQKKFDRFTVFPCPAKFLDKIERHYISLFRPKYNGTPPYGNHFLRGADAIEAARLMKETDWTVPDPGQ